MAQRGDKKRKPAAGRSKKTPAKRPAESRLDKLQRERDAFEAQLRAAEAKIAELEAQKSSAVDRIDKVIGALGHLISDKT